MNNPTDSNNEEARLRALLEYFLLDTLHEPVFDEVVRRTAALCETPIALLTLVDERRQWFKAKVGFALPELPRSMGFDALTILQSDPLIIRDALADRRTARDPLVTSELNIRFYAGVPLTTEEGYAIGALSVMDYTARDITPAQLRGLQDQAQQVMMHLDLRRKLMVATNRTQEEAPVKIYAVRSSVEDESRVILPDVMIRFGRDLRYMYVSPFSIETIGVRPDSLLGRMVGEERLPVQFAEPLRPALERALQNHRIEEIEFIYDSPAGERVFQTRLMPELTAGEVSAILSITRDITHEERRPSAPTSKPSLRALLGLAIADAGSRSSLLQQCVAALVQYSGARVVRIWLRDVQSGLLKLEASAGEASALLAGEPGRTYRELPPGAETLTDLAYSAFQVDAQDAEAHNLTSKEAFPLSAGGLLLGTVTLRDRRPLADEVRSEIVESMGTLAQALRRSQENESLAEQATHLAKELLDAKLALQREAENASSLAHELRTPLNSVLGLTNLLLGTQLSATQRELSEMTRTSARALLSIVNSTLDLARPEAGETELEIASFDLRLLLEDVGSILAPKAQAKGLDFVVRCSPTMPPRLMGDAGRIRQILTNLGDNAIKFTRQGYVLIDASHGDPVDGQISVVIDVEDSGEGIDPSQQEAIFDRYVRSGSSTDGPEQGVGLGLAISREFAEKMGGSIQLKSQPGSGSVFRLIIQLPVDAAQELMPSPDPNLAGARVLIVDGPQLQQFALREQLDYWGMRVNLCGTTGEMLDAMQFSLKKLDPYQIVLLDEQMAGSDSRAIIQSVLTTAGFRHARLAILTSVGRSRDVERMVAEGLAVSLTKPVRRMALWEMMLSLLHTLRTNPVELEPEGQGMPGPEDATNEPAEQAAAPEVRAINSPDEMLQDRAQIDTGPEAVGVEIGEREEPAARAPEEAIQLGPQHIDARFEVTREEQARAQTEEAKPQDTAAAATPPEEVMPMAAPYGEPADDISTNRAQQGDADAEESGEENAREAAEGTGHRQGRALVVEDDAVNRRVAHLMLERIGLTVDTASTGHEAMRLFTRQQYDLVLVDCKMDGMDGYEVAQAIRRVEGGQRHTAIIAVTADTSPGVKERCLAAGMDAYISKPMQSDQLEQQANALLHHAAPLATPPPAGNAEEVLDRRALMSRVAGNTEVLRSLANLCREECSRLLREIRGAITSGDRYEFLRTTHKLRGMLMSMEAQASVEAVRRLELTANQGRPADAEAMLNPLEQELARLQTVMDGIIGEVDR